MMEQHITQNPNRQPLSLALRILHRRGGFQTRTHPLSVVPTFSHPRRLQCAPRYNKNMTPEPCRVPMQAEPAPRGIPLQQRHVSHETTVQGTTRPADDELCAPINIIYGTSTTPLSKVQSDTFSILRSSCSQLLGPPRPGKTSTFVYRVNVHSRPDRLQPLSP